MDGLLIIDKPVGLTSHDVVARVRRILKTKRVGHTGTLDPFATGVLVLAVGRATRLIRFLDKDEKEYDALARFGFETDTGDRTGTPLEAENYTDLQQLTSERIESALVNFRGTIEQVPPMYSAKKVEGKKLYELARSGITIERKPVSVTIRELELTTLSDVSNNTRDAAFRVACSAGTYVRTLAEDIGRTLGVGAHLAELRRTRAGRFSMTDTVTLEALESSTEPAAMLLEADMAVAHLPLFTLPDDRIDKTLNGLSTRADDEYQDGSNVRMIDRIGNLIAVGIYNESEKTIQPKVVLG